MSGQESAKNTVGTPFTGETLLSALTVDQFITLVHSVESSEQMAAARQEVEVSKRIFADVEGLLNVTTPFRVKTPEELARLIGSLQGALTAVPGAELVFAVALVKHAGASYSKVQP